MPIVEVLSDGTVRFGRMKYTKDGGWTIRHIMETGEAGETVMKTLSVGIVHEGAKDANDFRFRSMFPEPVLIEFGPDQSVSNAVHMKVVMPVKVTGKLRDFDLVDGNETLGPITMIEAKRLILETEGRTVAFHTRATKATLVALAPNPKVFEKYRSIIESFNPAPLTPEQEEAISIYSGRW